MYYILDCSSAKGRRSSGAATWQQERLLLFKAARRYSDAEMFENHAGNGLL